MNISKRLETVSMLLMDIAYNVTEYKHVDLKDCLEDIADMADEIKNAYDRQKRGV